MFLPGMRTQFTHLTSPACIGNMQLKNRMVMSPMTTAYCNDDQTPSERLIRYFEERARGGVGLITMELITVDETHRYMHRSMTLGHDKYIEGHRRITDRIHQYGCKVQPQLSHTGPESVAQAVDRVERRIRAVEPRATRVFVEPEIAADEGGLEVPF